MKRIFKNVLLSLILVTLAACGSGNNQVEDTDQQKIKVGISQFMDHESLDKAREGFVDRLEESGLDVEIIVENQNGDMSLTNTSAESLNNKGLDLVYAIATPSAQGVMNVINDIPVIFSAVTDPKGAGLVVNLDKPESNITGISDYIDPEGQLDEFLKIFPDIKTMGVVYSTSEQNSQVQLEELKAALDARGIELEAVGISNINDISQAIAGLVGKIDALFAITDNTVAAGAPIIAKVLIDNQIPSLSAEEGQVENGLLMSQGVNYYKHGQQAADMAIRILNGESVEDNPVEYNLENEKAINYETMEALDIRIEE